MPNAATDGDGGGSSGDAASAANDLDASDAANEAEAAAACLADDGSAPNCAASKCPTECERVATRFKKGIARTSRAVSTGCRRVSPPTAASATPYRVTPTLATPRDQPLARIRPPRRSASRVDSCKDNGGEEITQATCEPMVKTLSAEGRAEFTSCITEGVPGYCTMGSSWCIEAMRY